MELEDLEDLVNLRISTEKRFLLHKLSEDAANGPDVHSQTVLLLSQQHFRCAVPESLDFVSERLDGETEGASESKISDFEGACLVNEEVLGLEVPVDDPAGVAVVESVAELVEEELDLVVAHALLVLAHVFLQVIIH